MNHRIVRALVFLFALLPASVAHAAIITLQWDRNTDPAVTGYLLSYGTQSGTYSTTIDVGNQVTWSVTLNPTGPSTYYFAVRAYAGAEISDYSAEVNTVVAQSQPVLTIDAPAQGSLQEGDLLISGWAVDKASTTGTGIDALHVYGFPNPGSGAPAVFLGVASYGGLRPDVAAALGAPRYTNSGFTLPVVGLTAGPWQVSVYAHSSVTNNFALVKSTQFFVVGVGPASRGVLAALGPPTMNSTVTSWLSAAGWALDLRSPGGPGVDVVQVWAYPNPGSGAQPLFLGNAPYGRARPDVGALFGSKFTNSGFHLDVMGMAEGMYDIVVLPRSTVSGAFELARVSRVIIRPSIVMTVDAPVVNATVATTFTLSGWAFDRRATASAGVDVLHVWAYPGNGGTPVFVGVATTGNSRPDVAAAWGAPYSHSGFSVTGSLAPGPYDLVLFARSTVSGDFENARVVHINVQ